MFSNNVGMNLLYIFIDDDRFITTSLYMYRHRSGSGHIKNMVDDVCYAIEFVRKELPSLLPGVDVDRIYIGGHSAGIFISEFPPDFSSFFVMR